MGIGTPRFCFLLCAAALALSVGAPKSAAAELPSNTCSLAGPDNLENATPDQLLALYREQAHKLRSIVIIGDFIGRADHRYGSKAATAQELPGLIMAQQPGQIRIIGHEPFLGRNIFDIASDGNETRVLIPYPFRFYIGAANIPPFPNYPLTNMRPQHVSNALMWEEPSKDAVPTLDRSSKTSSTVSLHVADGDASQVRTIDFDRASGDIRKVELRSASGETVAIFRYAGWTNTNGPAGSEPVCFPRHIWLERPQENYDLEIVVHRMDINQELPLARFHLDPPHGARVIRGENDITIAP